jgi:hypothetical protein
MIGEAVMVNGTRRGWMWAGVWFGSVMLVDVGFGGFEAEATFEERFRWRMKEEGRRIAAARQQRTGVMYPVLMRKTSWEVNSVRKRAAWK